MRFRLGGFVVVDDFVRFWDFEGLRAMRVFLFSGFSF